MAADGAQSVESRKRALEQKMWRALSKLRGIPYFRLEDYIHSAPPPETPVRCATEPLYISRPVSPRFSRKEAKRIQTYNPADG